MDVQTLTDMTEVVRACRTQGGTIDEQMAALAARTARAERIHSHGRAFLPGDMDRAKFELSLLSDKVLTLVADKYKKEGRL